MSETEITITHDALMDKHQKWASAEKDAASDAGERRQEIGAFAESTGVENKALSQVRAGLKIKNEGKRLDWLRSMEKMLPMVRDHLMGNQPEMPLEPENVVNLTSHDEPEVTGYVEPEVAPFDGEPVTA